MAVASTVTPSAGTAPMSMGVVSTNVDVGNSSVDMIRLERHLNEEARKQAGPDGAPRLRSLQRPFLSGNDRSRWCTVRALVEHCTYAIDDVVYLPRIAAKEQSLERRYPGFSDYRSRSWRLLPGVW